MGVYFKDMEKPRSCDECPLYCCPHNFIDCPAVAVPPHYDLIDHNALKIAVMDCDADTRIDFLKHAMDCINKAPVVIPSDMPTYEAEGGET